MCTTKCSYELLSKIASILNLLMSSTMSTSIWYPTVLRPESQCSAKVSTKTRLNPFTRICIVLSPSLLHIRYSTSAVISTVITLYPVCTAVIGAIVLCSILQLMTTTRKEILYESLRSLSSQHLTYSSPGR